MPCSELTCTNVSRIRHWSVIKLVVPCSQLCRSSALGPSRLSLAVPKVSMCFRGIGTSSGRQVAVKVGLREQAGSRASRVVCIAAGSPPILSSAIGRP